MAALVRGLERHGGRLLLRSRVRDILLEGVQPLLPCTLLPSSRGQGLDLRWCDVSSLRQETLHGSLMSYILRCNGHCSQAETMIFSKNGKWAM